MVQEKGEVMKQSVMVIAVGVLAAAAGGLPGEDPSDAGPRRAGMSKEHKWLQQRVGEWTYESEGIVNPSQPPVKSQGTESARALGGIWLVAESNGKAPDGAPMRGILTIGYDPEKRKFVATFISSGMTRLWTYEGSLDETEKILTLECDGPDPLKPGKTTKYKDMYEIKSRDHWVVTSSMLTADGKWFRFTTADYRRKKT
jgi:hypothetical protein